MLIVTFSVINKSECSLEVTILLDCRKGGEVGCVSEGASLTSLLICTMIVWRSEKESQTTKCTHKGSCGQKLSSGHGRDGSAEDVFHPSERNMMKSLAVD